MDQGRRTLNPNGSSGNPSQSSLGSLPSGNRRYVSGTPSDPWHSTPVKKSEIPKMTRQMSSPPALTTRTTSVHIPQDSQTLGEMDAATIQRQRRELQLLVAELKDRDQELNTMAAAHHKELQAWEHDRQRVLTLEQRCARLEDELHKRTEVIRALTMHIHIVESREKESHRDLNSTQQQLHELGKQQQSSSQECQDLEERNQSLNATVTSLSVQVGSLQVREEELRSMLRLKDKDVTEATNHIVDLSGRLRESEASLKELRSRETRLLREAQEHRRHRREARNDSTRLKEELQEQVTESSAQREEIIRLKQESQVLRRELVSAGERESWKDERLASARSKQERDESELYCLRQVCSKRQNDVQLLQLNLESAHEALRQKEGQGSPGRGSAVSESVASQGTERGRGTARRQAMSRSTDHKAPPFPFLTTESVWESGSTSDLTDVTMAASDLATCPTRSRSHSTGEKRQNQNSVGRHRTSVNTGSESSYGSVGNQGRESKDSMAACILAPATGSPGKSADQSVTGCFPSVSGNSVASSRPKQLFRDQESKCTNQETPGGNRTEAMTPSSVARTSASSNRGAQVRVSDRTAAYSRQGKSQSGASGNNRWAVGPRGRASGQTSLSGRASNYTGQGTLVRITEGDGSVETEGGVTTNPASLSGRAESPGCGCSSRAETTTCGCSSSLGVADGEAWPNCGCGSSITEGQTTFCSCCGSVAETTSCICSRVAERESGPCCGCASEEAGGQAEANPTSRPPSEAETGSGTGAGMGLLAVFNGAPEAEDSPVLVVSPRARVSVCNCQHDLTCIFLDDPSSWTRRSPGPANDSASPTTSDYLEDGDQRCSTNRLQRLLDETRQMAASLERTTLRPLSPSHNCDAVLSLGVSRDGGCSGSSHHHHHHLQASQGSPYHPALQTHQDSRSPPRSSKGLNQTKEPSGLERESIWKHLERHRDEGH